MPWLQVHIRADRRHAGQAEALLEALGALSVTLEDAADQPLLEPGPDEMPIWDATVVTGLFDANTDAHALRRAVTDGLPDPAAEVSIDALEDRPWERAWLEHFHPMRFGDRLWICPHGQRLPEPPQGHVSPVVLYLDPGLAFGTGTHPTTALCLEWLDQADLQGKTVIDYGCGSGILGIAALLLGASRVIAIDHDSQALSATQDNARANGVSDRLSTYLPEAAPSEAGDILIANILAGVLIDLRDRISVLVTPGGSVVMSGILETQVASVAAAYAASFALGPPVTKEDWVLLSGTKQ